MYIYEGSNHHNQWAFVAYDDLQGTLETETTAFQYPRTHTSDRGPHLPEAHLDLDRLTTQTVKGVFSRTCEDVCFVEGIDQEAFETCVFAKNGRECTAMQPQPPYLGHQQ